MGQEPRFVHLHCYSSYTLLEAMGRPESLVQRALNDNMPALALTECGNMFSALEFYFCAKAKGLKPIIGMEVLLAPTSMHVKNARAPGQNIPNLRLVLLAKNFKGYQNLCAISSAGFEEGFYYKARVDVELLQNYSEGLVALSGGVDGVASWSFEHEGADKCIGRLKALQDIYEDNFYLELIRQGAKAFKNSASRDREKKFEAFACGFSDKTGTPLVATNHVHYESLEDHEAYEALVCIGSNKTLYDETRYQLPSKEFYFKSTSSMRELFKDLPQAVDNTLKIASKCVFDFPLTNDNGEPIRRLPSFPAKCIKTEIKTLATQGLKRRLKEQSIKPALHKDYSDRLEHELGVIHSMGFSGYFLIVQDFIAWSKKHAVPVGPGRGSGAGSLVAYALGITDLDPLEHGLIFERFLNPERVSMPDFDIDFCQLGRPKVLEYVKNKYSRARVSQIITYGKLQARAALRDVGRVLGMSFVEQNNVIKHVPERLGISLAEALEESADLKELQSSQPRVRHMLSLAQKVEGLPRHAGVHAAGVVISDAPIKTVAPLYRSSDGENVIQYDMKCAEKIGLIKFDFLGLKTLTHIDYACKLVKKSRGIKLSPEQVALSDAGIYELMCRGDTAGVFQFESEGITELIVKAQPNCFADIVAINALYRPGPMEMIPDYLDRKSGRKKIEYIFPELESILKETYGIVVYQEQVQLIAARVAGFSLGEADILRRAMGKKNIEEMQQQKARFLDGAKKLGRDAKKSETLFDQMAEFAKYGFNKSHAAAYCVLSAQTAFLKNYYPAEFYAALLSTEMSDTDKVAKYVRLAKSHKSHAMSGTVKVKVPHVNYSDYLFGANKDEVCFSLGAIKGVGQGAVEDIVKERSRGGAFESVDDFFSRVPLDKINRKTLEALVKAGALDNLGEERHGLMSSLEKHITYANSQKASRALGQVSLFSMAPASGRVVSDPGVLPWTQSELLLHEKTALGFYLSQHPVKGLKDLLQGEVKGLGFVKTEKSKTSPNATEPLRILGVVAGLREILTKKGTRMAFAQIEDAEHTAEVIVFPNVYKECEKLLQKETPLLITGRVQSSTDSRSKLPQIIAEKIQSLADILNQVVQVEFDLSQTTPPLESVKDVVDAFRGATPVSFVLKHLDKTLRLERPASKGINSSLDFFYALRNRLGSLESVSIKTSISS